MAARTLGTQKKPPGQPHESPVATHATAPGAGSRLLSSLAQAFAIQASTSPGNNMQVQLPMLTLMHDARALELLEAVH